LVLKSEDPTLDEELLNLKLERLRILEQIRELETSTLVSLNNNNEETPSTDTSGDEYSTAEDSSPTTSTNTLTDEDLAKKLLADELTTLKQTGKTQEQIQRDISQQIETLMQQDPDFAQNLSNLEKDEKLARILEKQFLHNLTSQIEDDERLARKLYEEEQLSMYVPGSSPVPVNTFNGKKKRISPSNFPKLPSNFPMNKASPELRKHAVDVHNRYCTCKKISPGNNGHIFKTHDENCVCIKLHK
jgi:hypothetical protein